MSAVTVVRMVLHDVDAACARGIVHDGACVLELSATDMWMEHRGLGYQDITEERVMNRQELCAVCGKPLFPDTDRDIDFVCAWDPRMYHLDCGRPECVRGSECPTCGDAA